MPRAALRAETIQLDDEARLRQLGYKQELVSPVHPLPTCLTWQGCSSGSSQAEAQPWVDG
jgi:hypothetical protein